MPIGIGRFGIFMLYIVTVIASLARNIFDGPGTRSIIAVVPFAVGLLLLSETKGPG